MGAIRSGLFRLGRMCLGTVPASLPLNATTQAFGERVRTRRVELGLSQEAAAVRWGIHWTQLGKVERGQRSLRLETIVKIAGGLDVDAGRAPTTLQAGRRVKPPQGPSLPSGEAPGPLNGNRIEYFAGTPPPNKIQRPTVTKVGVQADKPTPSGLARMQA